jgi:putative membrane protein
MKKQVRHAFLTTAVVLIAAAAGAQQPGATGGGSSTRSSGAAPASAAISSGDRKFITEAAAGGLAEVQLGQLATEKASSADVKQFGRRMVDDHGKANQQLADIARQKNVAIPAELTGKHKQEYDRLARLSGDQFDRAYMRLMVEDHEKDVNEFRKQSRSARDPELKNFASQNLPTLEDHLRMARQHSNDTRGTSGTSSTKGTTSGKGGTTGTSGRTGTSGATSPNGNGTGGTPGTTNPSGTGAGSQR